MKISRKARTSILSIILLVSLGPIAICQSSEAVDQSIYRELLKSYVKDGWVDYRGLKNEEKRLDLYLEVLENADTKTLSRREQLAFYINAYNAWTLKLVLGGYPSLTSIKEMGNAFKSPWKKEICRLDGGILSLDHIEHKILRTRFKDPRVHFAINCASKGCPILQSEPYTGDLLDKQLESAVEGFVNDPIFNYLKGVTLYVSKIFEWYKADFNNDVIGYVKNYARKDLKKALDQNKGKIKVRYLDYDWTLNGE